MLAKCIDWDREWLTFNFDMHDVLDKPQTYRGQSIWADSQNDVSAQTFSGDRLESELYQRNVNSLFYIYLNIDMNT